jgi:uncharacterized damage-inducible protein DinB
MSMAEINAAEVLRRLHRYRIWSHEQLLAACRGLSPEQLHAPFAIGQGSVWSSLVHLLAADSLWLDAFEGRPQTPVPRDSDFESLDALAREWARVDQRWLALLANIDGARLDRTVTRADLRNQLLRIDGLDAHLQVCTHAAYTAAQVINMLRHLGIEPLPNCMLVAMSYAEGRLTALSSD